MKNPFTPNFGQEPLVMAGRDLLISEVINAFDNAPGDPALTSIFVGARGTGKTALLTLLASEAQARGWIAVNVPCIEGMLEEIVQGAALVAKTLVDFPDETRLTSVSVGQLFGLGWEHLEGLEPTWFIRLSSILDKLQEKDIGLLITVDEVQPNLDEMIRLASYYQLLIREERKVSLLMAGLPSKVSSLVSDKSVSFLRRACQYQLGAISAFDTGLALEQTVGQSGKSFSKNALEIAVDATQGFPFMMQLVGYRSWQAARERNLIDESAARQGVERAREDMKTRVLKATLDELSDGDLVYLQAMLDDNGISLTRDIARRLGQTDGYASQYRKRLVEQGIIDSSVRGKVAFALPMLREYLPEYLDARL